MAAKSDDLVSKAIGIACMLGLVVISWLLFKKFKASLFSEQSETDTGSGENPLEQAPREPRQNVATTIAKAQANQNKQPPTEYYLKLQPVERLRIAERLAGVSTKGGLNTRDRILLDAILKSLNEETDRALKSAVPRWVKNNDFTSVLDSKLANAKLNSVQQTAFFTRLGKLNLIKIKLIF